MAAILSSVSAYIIVASSAFGANIIRHYGKNMDDKKIVALQRGAVIVISLLAFLMSLKSDVVFAVALLASAGLGATFGPLVIFSLYSRHVNKTGAILSMISGLLTVIIWYYSGMSAYIYEAIPGILVSSLVLWIATSLSGGPDKESVETYERFIRILKHKGE